MKRFFSLIAIAVIGVSCITESGLDLSCEKGSLLSLSYVVDSLHSKVIMNSSSLPDGSNVGVFLLDTPSSDYYHGRDYRNKAYKVSGNQLINLDDNIELTSTFGVLYAYYPYFQGADICNLPVSLSPQVDYMYAQAVGELNHLNSSVTLNMRHALSVLSLNVIKGDYAGDGNISELTVSGSHLAAKGTYDGRDGSILARENFNSPILSDNGTFLLNTSGTLNDIILIPSGTSSDAVISVTLDGESKSVVIPGFKPEAGSRYYAVLSVNDIGLELSDISIENWITSGNKYNVYVSGNTENIAISQIVDSDGSIIISAVSTEAYEKVKPISYTGTASISQSLNNLNHRVIYVSDLKSDVYLNFDGLTDSSLKFKFYADLPGTFTVFGSSADLSSIRSMKLDGADCNVGSSVTVKSFGEHEISLYFDDGVTKIPHDLFRNSTNITSVSVPEQIEEIGLTSFFNCANLTSAIIPNVKTISESAFYGCERLKNIDISNVTSIGQGAFEYSGLRSITVPASTTIGYAFEHCESLTSVIFEEGRTVIQDYAFNYCKALTSIVFPASLKEVGTSAYSQCTSLSDVSLNSGLQIIGQSAFQGCTSLLSVVLPSSVKTIGNDAFRSCTSLSRLTLNEGVSTVGTQVFDGCTALTSVSIPSTLKSISKGLFRNCKGLKTLTISEGVTYLGYNAFYNCQSLTSVTIPSTVNMISKGVFWNCTNLSKIYCKPTTPPSVEYSTDTNILVNQSTNLYVPSGSLSSYTNWVDTWSYSLTVSTM